MNYKPETNECITDHNYVGKLSARDFSVTVKSDSLNVALKLQKEGVLVKIERFARTSVLFFTLFFERLAVNFKFNRTELVIETILFNIILI